MITVEKLAQRIDQEDAWSLVHAATGDAQPFHEWRRNLQPWDIHAAFGPHSIRDVNLRLKLHTFPIPELEIGPYSDGSMMYHLQSGLTDAMSIAGYLARHLRHNAGRSSRILDFGCGLARILRYFIEFAPENLYYACDTNDKAISWGASAFPRAKFIQMNATPPLPLKSGLLDAAYAFSIFTHYNEPVHLDWLEELARVLRPGGIAVITVHSQTLLDRLPHEQDMRDLMKLGPDDVPLVREKFDSYGYAFYESYAERARDFGTEPTLFGMSLVSPQYMSSRWSHWFDIVQADPGAVVRWQDYIVLRRRGPVLQWIKQHRNQLPPRPTPSETSQLQLTGTHRF